MITQTYGRTRLSAISASENNSKQLIIHLVQSRHLIIMINPWVADFYDTKKNVAMDILNRMRRADLGRPRMVNIEAVKELISITETFFLNQYTYVADTSGCLHVKLRAWLLRTLIRYSTSCVLCCLDIVSLERSTSWAYQWGCIFQA